MPILAKLVDEPYRPTAFEDTSCRSPAKRGVEKNSSRESDSPLMQHPGIMVLPRAQAIEQKHLASGDAEAQVETAATGNERHILVETAEDVAASVDVYT